MRQANDAQTQPYQDTSTEVEKEDVWYHGTESKPSRGQYRPNDSGQLPAKMVGKKTCQGT